MFHQAIHQAAPVGIGVFIGVWLMLFFMKRGGRDVQLLQGSVFKTAVAAGMGAWVVAAVLTAVL